MLYCSDKEGNPQMNSHWRHPLPDYSWLGLLWLLILSMGLSDVVHTPVTAQCPSDVSVLFSDQSLSIGELLNWDTFPSVILEQFGMKNQYSVILLLYPPQRLHASRSFPVCVIPTYWLVTMLTMDKIHRYQPLSILSQSYLSGDALSLWCHQDPISI